MNTWNALRASCCKHLNTRMFMCPRAYLPQNIKHRRQNYHNCENKTNWNNFPQVIKFLSSISWLCSCRPVLPQGLNETFSSEMLSEIIEKSLSKETQTNHTKNFCGTCLDVTWFHASCFSYLSLWWIYLSGLGSQNVLSLLQLTSWGEETKVFISFNVTNYL